MADPLDTEALQEALKQELATANKLEAETADVLRSIPAVEAEIAAKLDEKFKKVIEKANEKAKENTEREIAVMREFSKQIEMVNQDSFHFESLLSQMIAETLGEE